MEDRSTNDLVPRIKRFIAYTLRTNGKPLDLKMEGECKEMSVDVDNSRVTVEWVVKLTNESNATQQNTEI